MLRRVMVGSVVTLSGWQCHVEMIKYRKRVEVRELERKSGYLFRPGSTSDLMMDSIDVMTDSFRSILLHNETLGYGRVVDIQVRIKMQI